MKIILSQMELVNLARKALGVPGDTEIVISNDKPEGEYRPSPNYSYEGRGED